MRYVWRGYLSFCVIATTAIFVTAAWEAHQIERYVRQRNRNENS